MSLLIIAEHDNTDLKASTLNTLAAAVNIGGDIDILVVGSGCESVATQAAAVAGIRTVLVADKPAYEHQLAENCGQLIADQAGDYSHILMSATTTGKDTLPRVAGLLRVNPIADVIEVVSADTFKRPIYAGNAIATVQSVDIPCLLSIRSTGFDAVVAEGGSAEIKALDDDFSSEHSIFVSEEVAKSERPELTAASVIISGGRGLGSGDNFKLIYDLADKLSAAVGASRAAVDAGYVPNDLQVGQTGKIVAPELYVAVGISGAIQHLAGMKESKVIVAINKDEEAPIFQIADYGLVANLFDVLPELTEKV